MEKYSQLSFAQNGCIKPCPYREKCNTYKIGCGGKCYWCGRFDKKSNKNIK